MNVEEISKSLQRFGYLDYGVFVIMLVTCSCIGIYFGYQDHQKHKRNRLKERRGSEALDYLMGGRNLQVFPVAMSLVASYISGITLLGTSTEIYLYGTQYVFILIPVLFTYIFMYYVIIPVFHDLNITSTYEYLESRFDKRIRTFCSMMYAFASMLWMPIVIYVPALAFNQVTGVNIHIITPIVCLVCIFYTCLGGIKAVIWTDLIQTIIMFGVLALIVIKGTLNVGGLSVVIERNMESGRFEYPDLDFDPTIRHSLWAIIFGGTMFWMNSNGLSQSMVQRYLSLKDVKTARRGLLMYVIGVTLMILLCCYNGLLIYATYHDCDPLQTKLAKAKDQMLPLLVMDILKDLPGLPGLFIAGVFSAALSSLSTGLNSMAAVILEDFFKSFSKRPLTERETGIIMRTTVFVIGLSAVGLVYVVQHMGSVLQLSMSVLSSCFGPMFGIFIMGMFFPWINSNGALFGAVCSLILTSYVTFKAQAEIAIGKMSFEMKPMSVEGCDYIFQLDQSLTLSRNSSFPEIEKSIHQMSYLYYTGFGAVVTCLIGIIFCMIFGSEDISKVDPQLLAPFVRKLVCRKISNEKIVEKNLKSIIIHEFNEKGSTC